MRLSTMLSTPTVRSASQAQVEDLLKVKQTYHSMEMCESLPGDGEQNEGGVRLEGRHILRCQAELSVLTLGDDGSCGYTSSLDV